jgi:hypothetical protein
MSNPQPVYINTDQFFLTVKSFISHCWSKKYTYLILLEIGCVLALGVRYFSTPSYTATTSFVLEERTPGGGMAGLASQMGLDIGALSGASSGLLSAENITDIVRSNRIMEQALLSTINNSSRLLVNRYLNANPITNQGSWPKLLGVDTFLFQAAGAKNQIQDSLLQVIIKRIRKKDLQIERINKKGSIFNVSVKSSDPTFAAEMAERLVELTSSLYITIKTQTLAANVAKTEQKADSLRKLLGGKIAQTYSYQVLDANRVYTQNTIGAEVSTSDKAVLFARYGEVMKNLEWSRMMLVNQTPVVQVLDRPDFPLVDNRFSIVMYLFLGGILATLFFLLIQIIAYSNNKNKQ